MLNIEFIRNNLELVEKSCQMRGADFDSREFLEIDKKKRATNTLIDELRHQKNKLSQNKNLTPEEILQAKDLKEKIRALETKLKEFEESMDKLIGDLPNVLLSQVPPGKDDSSNKIIRRCGQRPNFDFNPRGHLDLGTELDVIDINRSAKVAGSRFGYIKSEMVLMQFALLNLVFKVATKFDFKPILPPVMIYPEWMGKMGYFDLKENNIYFIEKDNLNLVGTSEQSLAAMHQGEILENLPLRYIGYSTCFRREAGTYGRDLKGILRMHQFDKAELFSFCRPEESLKEHELFLKIEEEIMRLLELPYQVVLLSAGDLSKPSAMTIDIETWLPAEDRYCETHSSSNCTHYQSYGLDIRYRNQNGKTDYVHTINGTALAMGRILASILENYQNKDGSITVPKCLRRHVGFKRISR